MTTPLPVSPTFPASESVTYGPVPDYVTLKAKDHFYIAVNGVDGIRLRVDAQTIDHASLKIKVFEFYHNLMRHLG